MNWGRISVAAIILAALGTGGGIWYAQEYGYYDRIDPASPDARLTVATPEGPQVLNVTGFQGIDANSSPIRWRACGTVDARPEGTIVVLDPQPLIAPRWFDCFDANQIGEDLQHARAIAVLGTSDIHPDVDRVFAFYPDGRIFGWHQYTDKTPERGVMD